MLLVDEGRLHRDVDPAVDEPRCPDEANHHVELARCHDVERVDLRDPRVRDIGELHMRVEGDRRENRHLRGGVGAGNVVGGIGFRIAALLRVGERLVVALAAFHLGEHEVGRAVHDAEDAVDVGDDERLAQHLDHGNRRADTCLEAQLDARLRRGRKQLRTATRDELLVRGHDALAALQQLQYVTARRLDSAHHLRHHADAGVIEDLGEARGEHPSRGRVITLLRDVLDERLHDPQPVAGGAFDVICRFGEETVHR